MADTFGLSRSARDTVGWDTPANRATSWLVTDADDSPAIGAVLPAQSRCPHSRSQPELTLHLSLSLLEHTYASLEEVTAVPNALKSAIRKIIR
jgi:hypothetical protein